MDLPIPEDAWTLVQRRDLADLWVARTLLARGRLRWGVVEVRNHGAEEVLIDITPDEAPRLRLHTGALAAGWTGRRFDRGRREASAWAGRPCERCSDDIVTLWRSCSRPSGFVRCRRGRSV